MPEAREQEHRRGSAGVGRGDLWRAALAPALLAALALSQIALAHTLHLSPWKGGGFGMFSSTDHGAFRSVRAFAVGPEGERRLAIPSELVRQRRHAREIPRPGRLRGLAAQLAPGAPEARAIRVEVWRVEWSAAAGLRPTRRKLAEATLGLDP